MITASIEIIRMAHHHSFLVREFREHLFSAPYHFHPEYELTLILKGSGKRYIGNHQAGYSAGDLVLMGPNLPHCWKTDPATVLPGELNAQSLVIQFSHDFLGEDFLSRRELHAIALLLQQSAFGLQYTGAAQAAVAQRMMDLHAEQDDFKKLLSLLEILQQLAGSSEVQVLNHRDIIAGQSPRDRERMKVVYNYIIENFREDIQLNTAAKLANMSPNAFCKYFKKVTRKTFIETVNDYKLNYAAQQIIDTDKPIAGIAYDSGFGDLSHFNTCFRALFRQTPSDFRKQFNTPLPG